MNLRKRFPIFTHHPELVYLDSAATAHKPDVMIEAVSRFYAEDYATVHRSVYQGAVRATDLYHGARESVRKFIGAASIEEIVFTRGTTDAINLVAKAFPFEEGDEILVSHLEHHSNLVPWQMIAKEKRLLLKSIVLREDGTLDLKNLPLSPKTKLIAITHASNVTGTVIDLRAVVEQAKRVGAAVLVDGAQAAPHLFVDVAELDVDFYAFSGHKCYGPTGIGVLYGKKERLLTLSPRDGGGDMVDKVDFYESSYQKPPLRFEAGTPIIASAIGLGASLEFLQTVDRKALYRRETCLQEAVKKELSRWDGVMILNRGSEQVPLISFSINGVHPLDLASYLDCKNIAIRTGHLCAQPLLHLFGKTSVARVSFGLYNTEDDANQFLEATKSAIRLLRR